MKPEFKPLRAVVALFAAMIMAAASLAAPVSELSEEMHHAAVHADDGADQNMLASSDVAPSSPSHQHPNTPGHSHCNANCHVQGAGGRLTMTVAYAAAGVDFSPLTESLRPAAHLDGLFRPPRA